MLFSELYKIMANKATFVGLGGDRPNCPPFWIRPCCCRPLVILWRKWKASVMKVYIILSVLVQIILFIFMVSATTSSAKEIPTKTEQWQLYMLEQVSLSHMWPQQKSLVEGVETVNNMIKNFDTPFQSFLLSWFPPVCICVFHMQFSPKCRQNWIDCILRISITTKCKFGFQVKLTYLFISNQLPVTSLYLTEKQKFNCNFALAQGFPNSLCPWTPSAFR